MVLERPTRFWVGMNVAIVSPDFKRCYGTRFVMNIEERPRDNQLLLIFDEPINIDGPWRVTHVH